MIVSLIGRGEENERQLMGKPGVIFTTIHFLRNLRMGPVS